MTCSLLELQRTSHILSRSMGNRRTLLYLGSFTAACAAGQFGCQTQQTDIVRYIRLPDGTEYRYTNQSSGYGFNPNDTDEGISSTIGPEQARLRAASWSGPESQRIVPVQYVGVPVHAPMQSPVPQFPSAVGMWSHPGVAASYGSFGVRGVYPNGTGQLGSVGLPGALPLPGPVLLPHVGNCGFGPGTHPAWPQGAPVWSPLGRAW